MDKLVLIPTDKTEIVWRLAADHLKKAMDHSDGLVTLEESHKGVLNGSRQLWLIWDEEEKKCRAALVTQMIKGVCLIWQLGGEGMRDWLHMLQDGLIAWAREQGCTGLHLYGRQGWLRVLEPLGWTQQLVVMHKEI